MSSTVFRNASGLPNSEQVTTARDLARLANALMRDYPALLRGSSRSRASSLSRPHARKPQSHARQLRRRRRSEDRLHQRLRLQPRDVGGTRQPPPDRRGDGRQQRRPARPHDGRPHGSRLQRWRAMQLSPWTSMRKPPSARYTAAQFDPGASFAEAYRPPAALTPQQAQQQQVSPGACRVSWRPLRRSRPPPRRPSPPPPPARRLRCTSDTPALGSWVIQVGSFSEPQAAQAALERATAALPDTALGLGHRRRSADGQPASSIARGSSTCRRNRPPRAASASRSGRSIARRSRSRPGIRRVHAEGARRQGRSTNDALVDGAARASGPTVPWLGFSSRLGWARRPTLRSSSACTFTRSGATR